MKRRQEFRPRALRCWWLSQFVTGLEMSIALYMLSEISRSIIPVSVTIFEECRFILWRGHFVLFVRLHTCKAQCRISFRIIVQPPEFSKPFWLEWSHSPWLLSFRICIGCRWLINCVDILYTRLLTHQIGPWPVWSGIEDQIHLKPSQGCNAPTP